MKDNQVVNMSCCEAPEVDVTNEIYHCDDRKR